MNKSISIYVFTEPDTGNVRYIGRSNNPHTRCEGHLNDARLPDRKWRTASPLTAWLRVLRDRDARPGLLIIESDIQTLEDAKIREDYWINHYLNEGCSLLNVSRNHGPNLKHQEYYNEARVKIVELAAPTFLARQIEGEPFRWDGEPRWLRERMLRYIRADYSQRPIEQQISDYLNNYDFSTLSLDKLENVLAIIEE